MRALAPRRWPLALRVPLLITLLMIGVAGAISKLVLLRLEATQEEHFEELSGAYLDGLSTALLPAMIRRDPWEAFDALDRSRARYRGVAALRVLVVLPDGTVLAASDPIRHPLGAAAPRRPRRAACHLAPGAAARLDPPRGQRGRRADRAHRGGGGCHRLRGRAAGDAARAGRRERGADAALRAARLAAGAPHAAPGAAAVGASGRAAEGRLDPIPEAELPPADTEAGRAFRRYNAAAAAIAEREALLTRLAEEERRALVGRYASAMAHEVNNPLGGLFNAVRMIQRHGDDPGTARCARRACSSAG
jgi:signal transduction histidine kinase